VTGNEKGEEKGKGWN